jgi:hypothetical protein
LQKFVNLFVVAATILTATSAFALMRIEPGAGSETVGTPIAGAAPTITLPAALLSLGQMTGQTPPTVPPMPTSRPGARPIVAVDLGIQQGPTGPTGLLPGQLGCDDAGTLRIQTSGGTMLAGILQDGGWTCQATLTQWQNVAPRTSQLGVQYRPPQDGRPAALTVVNQEGRSMAITVNGAWSLD